LPGGTAGCVFASRLSDAHPELSILIIERGSNNDDNAAVDNPLFWLSNVMTQNPRMLIYHGVDEPQIGNRGVDIFTGSVLGGGSSINCMAYSRAQSKAMDEWRIPGWGAKDLWPYMKKVSNRLLDPLFLFLCLLLKLGARRRSRPITTSLARLTSTDTMGLFISLLTALGDQRDCRTRS
jgi:choline dehydrogenase-like flavoprotein